MTVHVEMCYGLNFFYKGQLYRRYADDGKTPMIYEVDGVLAAELMEKKTRRDIPYFRILANLGEAAPPEPEPEPEPEPQVVKVTRDPKQDNPPPAPSNVVKVRAKKKTGKKKKIVKKVGKKKKVAPQRITQSQEGNEAASDEV